MKLSNLLDIDKLNQHIADGYINKQYHPKDKNLYILNYSHTCQFAKLWDDVTIKCRGLIVEGNEVIAKGPDKFFNYGESDVDLGKGPFNAYDKLDGSLGILYHGPDGFAIATRGSFASEQAIKATEMLNTTYKNSGILSYYSDTAVETQVFEIIYPENRIVCKYDDEEALYFLGTVSSTKDKDELLTHDLTGFKTPEVFTFNSLQEVLNNLNRAGKEGLVVHSDGKMVKFKQEDYVRIHRIVTNLTPLRIWESWSQGTSLDDFIEDIPDEFYPIIKEYWEDFENEYEYKMCMVTLDYLKVKDIEDRKEFALAVKDLPNPGFLFAMRDGRDKHIVDKIIENLHPSGKLKLFKEE